MKNLNLSKFVTRAAGALLVLTLSAVLLVSSSPPAWAARSEWDIIAGGEDIPIGGGLDHISLGKSLWDDYLKKSPPEFKKKMEDMYKKNPEQAYKQIGELAAERIMNIEEYYQKEMKDCMLTKDKDFMSPCDMVIGSDYCRYIAWGSVKKAYGGIPELEFFSFGPRERIYQAVKKSVDDCLKQQREQLMSGGTTGGKKKGGDNGVAH